MNLEASLSPGFVCLLPRHHEIFMMIRTLVSALLCLVLPASLWAQQGPDSYVQGQRVKVDVDLQDDGQLVAETIGTEGHAGDSNVGLSGDEVASSVIRRDDDEPVIAPLRVGRVYFGGRIGYRFEVNRDRDLDERRPDDVNRLVMEAQVEVSAPLSESVEAYGRFNLRHNESLGINPMSVADTRAEVREAYLLVTNFMHRRLALQVGRQRFRDRREWLYDDRLDAVRLHYARDGWVSEVAVARTLFGGKGSRSDQLYLIARTEVQLPNRNYVAGYWVKRNDTTDRDEDPVWIGLSARGRVYGGLRYWSELALARGRRKDRSLRGWGADVGSSYEFPGPWQPTLALSYAYGSGDDDVGDKVDGKFRQTRLNDNSARIGGLKRHHYYGVAIEPELSNLKIASADFGVRRSDAWSLNLAFHDYRQAVASKRVGDVEIDIEPNGHNPRYGRAFDLVFALRRFSRVDTNVLVGWFQPGPAFEGARSPFLVISQELRYYF